MFKSPEEPRSIFHYNEYYACKKPVDKLTLNCENQKMFILWLEQQESQFKFDLYSTAFENLFRIRKGIKAILRKKKSTDPISDKIILCWEDTDSPPKDFTFNKINY